MEKIEKLANVFISAYNSSDKQEKERIAYMFLREIKRDEWQLRTAEHTYAIAHSMYYLLMLNKGLSDRDFDTIVRLIYYCILRNYSDNYEAISSDDKYSELVSSCELGFIVLCKSGQFLMYGLLTGAFKYLPNFAQKHIVDQMLLFGGIVKEAHENGYHHCGDSNISKRCNSLLQEVYDNIPVGENLQSYREGCLPTIQQIFKDIEFGFTFEDDDLF